MSDWLLWAIFAGTLVNLFFLTKPAIITTSFQDNHTIPRSAALQIAIAQIEDKPAIFHGGCQGCIWRHQNTTHTGIAFCRGCLYFSWDQSLPDKSINEYDLEKIRGRG